MLELLERKIKEIVQDTDSTEEPIMYLTASQSMVDSINKRNKGRTVISYSPNFRDAIAKQKPYKGNRNQGKPFHFNNLSMYLYNNYDCRLAVGIEADDLISIDNHRLTDEQTRPIICSRDKDLKITPGYHYGWACGKSPSFPVRHIDKLGFLDKPVKGKLVGGGLKFFYSQCLTGDTVDNVPGLPLYGPVKSHTLLAEAKSEQELYDIVIAEYIKVHGDKAKEIFTEQANLLWIVQQLDSNGNPVLYNFNKDL